VACDLKLQHGHSSKKIGGSLYAVTRELSNCISVTTPDWWFNQTWTRGFKQTQFRLGQQKLHPHKLKPPTLAKHGSTPLTPTLTDRDDSAPLQRASWAYSPQLH